MSADAPGDAAGRPTRAVSLTVNGETVEAEVEPRLKLSDFLRNHCGLHGVRVGCEHGVCGACTVSLDGDIVKSCLVYAIQADGREIGTVEGLAEGGELGPVQRAFHEEHALQCGFCTSGFVMATRDLLERNPDPSDEEIRKGLADNICRCTGYQNIYEAVHQAAEEMDANGDSDPDGAPEADAEAD
ncbi:(2Fe-2S)-binding protein [Halobacteriales archaeon QH_9_66_26]|nr:MAG: (2Fe-2S)-binding protein [Halobacteriales archaeon QH_9_66_26]